MSIPGTQSLSGLTTVVADKCLVSPPEITKRPKDIFEQFLRVPQGISVYDGVWSAVDDEHCPGTESILRFLKRRPRTVMLDASSTFYITKKIMNNRSDNKRRPFLLTYETTLFYRGRRGRDGRGIESVNVTEEYKLHVRYTDETEWTSEQSIRGPQGPEGPPSEVPGPPGAPGITTYAVVPIGLGFDTSTQPPRGPRGARGRDGAAGRDGRAFGSFGSFTASELFSTGLRGRPGHDGKDGRLFLLPEEPLFLPKQGKPGKRGKAFFLTEPVFMPKNGKAGPRGKSNPLILSNQSFSFYRRQDIQRKLSLFQRQENFFLVRPKKVVPQPLLLSTEVYHSHQRHFVKRNYQNSVSTHLNHWLLKTVQRKTVQQILPTTHQSFVTQKHRHVQNFLLQKQTTEQYQINRYHSEKKTQLLQTFSNSSSLRQTTVNKTLHLYQAPVSYHFVQSSSKIERLVQRGINSNGLVFTGDSAMILSGDAGVSIA